MRYYDGAWCCQVLSTSRLPNSVRLSCSSHSLKSHAPDPPALLCQHSHPPVQTNIKLARTACRLTHLLSVLPVCRYNPNDKRLSTVAAGLDKPRDQLRDQNACLHIWDGQDTAPDRNSYKAYVALCDKEWAQGGNALVSHLYHTAQLAAVTAAWHAAPT
jgi:hypothetical protein